MYYEYAYLLQVIFYDTTKLICLVKLVTYCWRTYIFAIFKLQKIAFQILNVKKTA